MELADRAFPVPMRRVAVVSLAVRVREVLVVLAESGVVELAGPLGSGEGPALDALRRLESRQSGGARAQPSLARVAPDVDRLERTGARAVLAGEVELERRRTSAVQHGSFAVFVGWAPKPAIEQLSARLEACGASLVPLGRPRGQQPPTLLAPAPAADPFRPLLSTYGAVPYRDVDPTPFVAVTYCLMFGMMFGDVGDGLLIVVAALALRGARGPRLAALRRVWPMIAAAGASSVVFGALYGELFGPTNLLPTLWLSPLDESTRLLAVAIAAGAGLLAIAYLIGIVNRWREGGPALALTAGAGVPGFMLLTGGALVAAGVAIGARLTGNHRSRARDRGARAAYGWPPRASRWWRHRRARGRDRAVRRARASVLERLLVRAAGRLRLDARGDRTGRAACGREPARNPGR